MSKDTVLAKVRLDDSEVSGIINSLQQVADDSGVSLSSIDLFGSRTNLEAKGGDIDLYVLLDVSSQKAFDLDGLRRKMKRALMDTIGEQKIDLIIDDGKIDLGAFGKIISQTKVNLWTK